jgi:hypothetical protein
MNQSRRLLPNNMFQWLTVIGTLAGLIGILVLIQSATGQESIHPQDPPKQTAIVPVQVQKPASRQKLDDDPAPSRGHMVLPPAQYDRPYDGDLTLTIVGTFVELKDNCNINDPLMVACAIQRQKSCHIYMMPDFILRTRGTNSGIMLRHEIGHCNGWAAHHPGVRPLPWPLTLWVPANERRDSNTIDVTPPLTDFIVRDGIIMECAPGKMPVLPKRDHCE